ncbi:copper chaperone PCu(A)C [Pollutimonas sp. M17]|uniref:copper chaperone PCu(A)C n=1 Tax=Pollutimonas sp. M17 TaxID=2962065 RepID=UPI0021F49FBD|nr:copper chaperone PCu(A)C [Pollutimonas sp. M17]UYO94454.1 copper chaperone PCu(A)C [Pollutimonas sp. M17]
MKKMILIGLAAIGGAAAVSAQAADMSVRQDDAVMMLAHAGHAHAQHGHDMGKHAQAMADAKTSSTLSVSACWIRSLPAPAPSAGYFLVKNTGSQPAKLQSASSPTYGMVMLHQTTQHEGMSKMSETHDIAIPAGGELEFKPGGYHAMLEKPSAAPAVGSHVSMDFLFDTGEKASAQCEVKPANTKGH